MKKGFLILLVVILAFGMGACGAEKPAEEGDTPTIGLVVSTLNNPFFVDLRDGAQAKADELKATLVVLDSQDDASTEMSNVEDLITQGVDLILINPTDSDAVGSAVAAANEAGIPVITLDRAANSGEVAVHIASDNVAGGEMAGKYIIEKLDGKGKVVELEGIPGASAARDRGEGFNKAIKDSGLEVVAKQTANFDRAEGLSVMENILQAQPEIDAVFAHNDEMALGALEAIKDSGRDILVVGFDATDDAIAAVEAGTMAATVQQLPKEIGASGVDAALKVIGGENIDTYIPVELQLVTKK
ncbi:ribose ABC transporter substrate-binding protein RbsB [Sinanaerobacter sp. ZZT-01]|uniref:ribose ABC transporter substrate-binding protein RbsB n=1 Tax=Sinanaerobacter sp. ZZT-01 TaxID=3111540 RepID=UPI002D77E398|nr:ribose ABC transporter substrate-binding protein RbsB [Sinanaerobacter sp. ZZT-01]WRR92018.1 ribose ABC transporter substrate-binding protein RbsB [Sinanaerobacter sp. ZZT-01]